MQRINGKELAQKLRVFNSCFCLVFVSAYDKEVFNTLKFNVNSFIPKSSTNNYYNTELVRVLVAAENASLDLVLFETINEEGNKRIIKMPLMEVYYFICISKNCYLHSRNIEYRLTGKKYEELKKTYATQGFFEVCRGYLVNLYRIHSINVADLVLDNQEIIPVSRRKRKFLIDAFSNLLMLRGLK